MATPPDPVIASVISRLEQLAQLGARTVQLSPEPDGGFAAYATRIADLCIRELAGDVPAPKLYDFDQDG
jgi:hypothetical protein